MPNWMTCELLLGLTAAWGFFGMTAFRHEQKFHVRVLWPYFVLLIYFVMLLNFFIELIIWFFKKENK